MSIIVNFSTYCRPFTLKPLKTSESDHTSLAHGLTISLSLVRTHQLYRVQYVYAQMQCQIPLNFFAFPLTIGLFWFFCLTIVIIFNGLDVLIVLATFTAVTFNLPLGSWLSLVNFGSYIDYTVFWFLYILVVDRTLFPQYLRVLLVCWFAGSLVRWFCWSAGSLGLLVGWPVGWFL